MNELIEQLGWTLMHSLWQLAALAVVLMLLLRLLQHASANSRYLAASLTLLLMAAAPPVTFYAQQSQSVAPAPCTQPISNNISPESTLASFPASTESAYSPPAASSRAPAAQAPQSWRQRITDAVRPWLMTIVAVWLVGVALLSLRPLTGWRVVRRLRSVGTSPASPAVIDLAQRCAARLRVGSIVQVVQSSLVEVPAVVGWLRPIILLPVGIASGLTPMQLEAVLAHELAHVRRRDYLVNLLQTIVETLLFYHPAVWWVSHQMRLEREDCCDDLALTVCGNRREYAVTLLALDELRPAVPAVAMSGGSLLSRVRRILLGSSATSPHSPSTLGALGLICVVLMVGLVYLQTAPTVAEEPTRSASEQANPLGTLTGRFTFDGPIPKPVMPPDESLVVNADGRLANVLIYLISPNAPQSADNLPPQVNLRLLDRRFQPHVVALHTSQALFAENLDREAMNVNLQGLSNAINRLLPSRTDVTLQLSAEKLPMRVTNNIYPAMQAFILPHANPFHAVSQADGSFSIANLPPGEWEFRAWHERCGYVDTEQWPKGRFTLQIKPGQNDLGEIKLPALLFVKAEKPVEPQATRPQNATADPWFWPDPYSHMGHDELSGLGWYYVRLAMDNAAGEDLKTTPEQRQAIGEIMQQYRQRERDLGKRLAEEGIDTPTRLARRKEFWLTARDDVRKQLSQSQQQRVDQLLIQRLSYSVFKYPDLIKPLELTDDQQQRIKAAIAAHNMRIRDEELELDVSAKQTQGTPLEDQLLKLRAAKEHRGRLSHRRVWDEVRETFTPQQREQFVKLRGPMAEAVRPLLPHFEPNPPARNPSLQ